MQPVRTEAIEPFFTLVAKTNGGGIRPDYLNLLQQQLARIGIHLKVIIQDWPTFAVELLSYRDFDICYLGLSHGGVDPDFTGVYDENGSLNLFGYHTSMDYDEALGTGKNEWFITQGRQIMPPNSQERIDHYHAWQQYLMDDICPLRPLFVPKNYIAYWSNLEGYDITKGILQSWGSMTWDGIHKGQVNTNEFVISDAAWSDLNPLFQDDTSSSFISSAIIDKLIWYDPDASVWPHLAKSVTYINDTTIEIVCREGIRWNDDPDGLFSNEYFSAEDVFFTLSLWGYVSCDTYLTSWMDELEIIDEMTLRIHIDGDSSTPEKEPYAPGLAFLSTRILPEHYLNQTQQGDGIMPDISHPSWNTFATHPFGTGLFELTDFSERYETILTVRSDSWWVNPVLTNDPDLNWKQRFGDFSGGLEQLRVRIIPDVESALIAFENGNIDLEGVYNFRAKREQFILDPDFEVQLDIMHIISFFGYNMREVRFPMGLRDPSPLEPSITIGLAIRKAISYAINREEMNDIVHGGEYSISDWPIYSKMGVWCNPNIIKYDFDLEKAKEYMTKAGFDTCPPLTSPGLTFGITFVTIISVASISIIISNRKKKIICS